MSLLTRCPGCSNIYKVVDDQLRMSEGWVRCGQCGEVFEASLQVVEPVTVMLEPEPEQTHQPASADPAEMDAPSAMDEPSISQAHTPSQASEPSNTVPLSEPLLESAPESEPEPSGLAEPMLLKESAPELSSTLEAVTPAVDQLAADQLVFLQAPKQPALWERTGVRITMGLSCLLLMLALLGQWLYGERDRLATARPELKPVLQWLCQPLNCRIEAMRRAEALVIESSAFTVAGKDSYQLSFLVRNMSTLAVAVPHIELTLTDSLEHVLVRRVLTPAEIGFIAKALSAQAQWPVSLVLHLELDSALVLGYQLTLFYP